MYVRGGLGLFPGGTRITAPIDQTADGTVSSTSRDAGILPLDRTGGIPGYRETPLDLISVAPETAPTAPEPAADVPMAVGLGPVPAVFATPAPTASMFSSIPWWGWAAGLGAAGWFFLGGRKR